MVRAVLQKKASVSQEEEARVLLAQMVPRRAGRAEGHRRRMAMKLPALERTNQQRRRTASAAEAGLDLPPARFPACPPLCRWSVSSLPSFSP